LTAPWGCILTTITGMNGTLLRSACVQELQAYPEVYIESADVFNNAEPRDLRWVFHV